MSLNSNSGTKATACKLLLVGMVVIAWGVFLFLMARQHRALVSQTAESHLPARSGPAELRKGLAFPPANAPEPVRRAIWAANALAQDPEGRPESPALWNYNYDSAGVISMVLSYAGLTEHLMRAKDFADFGEPGEGHWITIYVRGSEVYGLFCGLRFEVTDERFRPGRPPHWTEDERPRRGFTTRHPAGF